MAIDKPIGSNVRRMKY